MNSTTFTQFNDSRISFEYPDRFSVWTGSDPGQLYYKLFLPDVALPMAVLEVFEEELNASHIETQLRKFVPANDAMFMQEIKTRGPVQTDLYLGFELWTVGKRPSTGVFVVAGIDTVMDFGHKWIHFTLASDEEIEETVWRHVINSIRPQNKSSSRNDLPSK
jgi:hypothetical protein